MELDATITTPKAASTIVTVDSDGSKRPPSAPRRTASLARCLRRPMSARLEAGEADQDKYARDNPEAHDHPRLRPALEFEVVVDRRHAEHALAGQLETGDLDHHRKGFDDEDAAHHHQDEFLAH